MRLRPNDNRPQAREERYQGSNVQTSELITEETNADTTKNLSDRNHGSNHRGLCTIKSEFQATKVRNLSQNNDLAQHAGPSEDQKD